MKLINHSFEIIDRLEEAEILKKLELIGRVCYKSEKFICDGSAERFVNMIIRNGHESILEHHSFSVRFIIDRATANELVRHRMASFAQESQRYVNYGGLDIEFIDPCCFDDTEGKHLYCDEYETDKTLFKSYLESVEVLYNMLLNEGYTPELARTVLPNATKTEIVVTANIREWRHILKLRTAPDAHPVMRDIMTQLLETLQWHLPLLFSDIGVADV